MTFSTLFQPGMSPDPLMQVQDGSQPNPNSKLEKIRKYAGEFEANLLANLYKDMQHSLGEVPGQEDPGADTLMDMGVHALANGISAAGGIGIANLLIQHLISKGKVADTSGGNR